MKATAIALSSIMISSPVLPVMASDLNPLYTYKGGNGATFEKVSHAGSGVETADGIVDYAGNGLISPYVQGVSEEGNGDRGQSYSYASVSYGDWVYINTMYGGLGVNAILSRSLNGMTPEAAETLIQTMYNGHMYTGEPDGDTSGGMLVKFNTKTGETKILMSKTTDGIMPTFRSAIKMNNKLYFVGMVMDTNNTELTKQEIAYATAVQNGFPCIYEVDPENDDKLTCIYNCVDTNGFRKLVNDNVFTSTRAIGTYENAMIAGCLDTNGVFLTASKDPSAGQDSFHVIADMDDLFNYPAYHRSDVNGGGGIYQVVEYNGALYVVVCTGTEDSKNENGTLQSFAIVKGVCNGDVTDKDAWTWSVIAGDEADGAKYPFGLDSERISAGACTLQVYGDYLYIGDYNDVSSALQGFILKKDFTTQATNLDQSINLYRMDKNENIEKVVGDPTTAFPTSLTGLGSGYTSSDSGDSKMGTHMNQYTWQTTVYDGKLYVGTMDTTTLLEPIAQFTNGDLLDMSQDEWKSQLNYIRVLIELMTKKNESESTSLNKAAAVSVQDEDKTSEEVVQDAISDAQETAIASNVDDDIALTAEQTSELTQAVDDDQIESVDADVTTDLTDMNDTMSEMTDLIDTTDTEAFAESYSELVDQYDSVEDQLPENLKGLYQTLVNYATRDNIEGLLKSVKYLKTSEAGFDLFEISNNEDGSVQVEKVTTDGFGDRFNHGLRVFDKTDNYWVIGTANPFNGTQLWRTANLEETSSTDSTPDASETETPKTDSSENTKPNVTPEKTPEETTPEAKPDTETKPDISNKEDKGEKGESSETQPETSKPEQAFKKWITASMNKFIAQMKVVKNFWNQLSPIHFFTTK